MRRSDKEIKDSQTIKKVFEEAEICRIALVDGDEPYLVPMNFGYKNNTLYLHSATEGHKIDILKENNSICFQMDIKTEIIASDNPCNWSVKYLSVIGNGKAQLIDNATEKINALNIIMGKYAPDIASFEYLDEAVRKVSVIKVKIDGITGKKSGY
ncbi:pyridoxamine 5'-phosphate oxidase family protein [uncultured Methanobacterium sp.]|uniref:pyridoxamine 5'-phosphate oxidase family protein n=1 Tax=uncultured Methanobacterium sp. TaxID=176306 RepID=UPI002AA72879|nr:pyridoxamine 5'-phosphate oxidase family protein [uncultured Methanobacterium sp.]